jgi:hypothetical protein
MAKSRRQQNLTNESIDSLIARIAALESPIIMIANTASNTASTPSTTYKFTNVIKDTNSAYSTITGNFTCPTDGTYLISAAIGVATNAIFTVLKNGVRVVDFPASGAGSSSQISGGTVEWIFNAGDTIAISSQSAVTASGSATANYFMVSRIGA